jgi:hypothetical protein
LDWVLLAGKEAEITGTRSGRRVESLLVTPPNERLPQHIRSIREKIFTAIRELEELGVGPKDVPAEEG